MGGVGSSVAAAAAAPNECLQHVQSCRQRVTVDLTLYFPRFSKTKDIFMRGQHGAQVRIECVHVGGNGSPPSGMAITRCSCNQMNAKNVKWEHARVESYG